MKGNIVEETPTKRTIILPEPTSKDKIKMELRQPVEEIVTIIRKASQLKEYNLTKEDIRDIKNSVVHAVKTADK